MQDKCKRPTKKSAGKSRARLPATRLQSKKTCFSQTEIHIPIIMAKSKTLPRRINPPAKALNLTRRIIRVHADLSGWAESGLHRR
jgi:hypothetical protein